MRNGQKNFEYFLISIKGMAMGIADLIPGVSGGTIAFITGIYEELIDSLSELKFSLIKDLHKKGFKYFWKKINAPFLISLFFGISVSVLLFSKFITWLLVDYPILTWSFFFGLVLSSILYVIKKIKKWNLITALLLIVGTIVAYQITKLEAFNSTDSYLYIFISGAVAICAMILPGISGAFILVLMGSYSSILQAISNKEILKILSFVAGAIIGLLTFSKFLKFLFNKYKNETFSILTGFMTGALVKIWPWKKLINSEVKQFKSEVFYEECVSPFSFDGDPKLIQAMIFMFLGVLLIFIFSNIPRKQKIS
jgi:putative membrane protein